MQEPSRTTVAMAPSRIILVALWRFTSKFSELRISLAAPNESLLARHQIADPHIDARFDQSADSRTVFPYTIDIDWGQSKVKSGGDDEQRSSVHAEIHFSISFTN